MKYSDLIRSKPVLPLNGNSNEFQFLCEIPGHRKFFKHIPSGRITIADYSGDYPDQTDCGPLYINQLKPIFAVVFKTGGLTLQVPIVNDEGESVWTSSTWTEAYYLREEHGMDLVMPLDPRLLKETLDVEAVDLTEWYDTRKLSDAGELDFSEPDAQCQECGC
jgi:hypothetical protein